MTSRGGSCFADPSTLFIDLLQATYLLVHRAVYGRPNDTTGKFRAPSVRACVALLIHECRICLIVQFVSASALLIATGDGAFNVMLNSLAVTFLLDLDGQIVGSSTFVPDSLSPHYVPPCRHNSRVWCDVVNGLLQHRAKAVFRSGVAQRMTVMVAFIAVLCTSWTMQGRTSYGMYFKLQESAVYWDDATGPPDFSSANNYTTVATAFTWSFLLFFVLCNTTLVASSATGSIGGRFTPRVAFATAFELVTTFLLYAALTHYIIGNIFMAWKTDGGIFTPTYAPTPAPSMMNTL